MCLGTSSGSDEGCLTVDKAIKFCCSGLYDTLHETSKELIDLVKLVQVNNGLVGKKVRLFYLFNFLLILVFCDLIADIYEISL